MLNIIKKYAINTFICIVFFTPIVMYGYLVNGRLLNEDDLITIFLFGWLFGAMINSIFKTTVKTSKGAIETIEELKNNYKEK